MEIRRLTKHLLPVAPCLTRIRGVQGVDARGYSKEFSSGLGQSFPNGKGKVQMTPLVIPDGIFELMNLLFVDILRVFSETYIGLELWAADSRVAPHSPKTRNSQKRSRRPHCESLVDVQNVDVQAGRCAFPLVTTAVYKYFGSELAAWGTCMILILP